jgi:hypothetical protein
MKSPRSIEQLYLDVFDRRNRVFTADGGTVYMSDSSGGAIVCEANYMDAGAGELIAELLNLARAMAFRNVVDTDQWYSAEMREAMKQDV